MKGITKRVIDLNKTAAGRAELRTIYKNLFTGDAGQIVLEDLKLRTHYRVTTADVAQDAVGNANYVPNSESMLFREGMRSVVLLIQDNLDYEPGEGEA